MRRFSALLMLVLLLAASPRAAHAGAEVVVCVTTRDQFPGGQLKLIAPTSGDSGLLKVFVAHPGGEKYSLVKSAVIDRERYSDGLAIYVPSGKGDMHLTLPLPESGQHWGRLWMGRDVKYLGFNDNVLVGDEGRPLFRVSGRSANHEIDLRCEWKTL